jgi:hypothetical protein
MKEVWKFPLELTDAQIVQMPDGAKPIFVGIQNGMPHVWAEVNAMLAPESKVFYTHGTGHPIPSDRAYVGTYMHGPFVWHVYTKDTND